MLFQGCAAAAKRLQDCARLPATLAPFLQSRQQGLQPREGLVLLLLGRCPALPLAQAPRHSCLRDLFVGELLVLFL